MAWKLVGIAMMMGLVGAPALAAELTVEPVSVVETKAVFGKVMSRTVVPARARIGGTVQEITVNEGSEVEKGEVIALITDDKLAIQRDAAASQVKAVRSQLENAQTDLERARELLSRGTGPQSRVDAADTQVRVYANQLAAAQSQQAVIEQQAREGSVLAPASGRVLDVPVTPGSVIMAGESVASIAGGGYFLRLSLPERHAATIHEGDAVMVGQRVLTAAGEDTMKARQGKLVKVYPEIVSGRVEADVEVDGLGGYFVGERTLVWLPVGHRSILAVPPAAVETRHGIDMITLAGGGEEKVVSVVLGQRIELDERSLVEVLTGLQPGDQVIVP